MTTETSAAMTAEQIEAALTGLAPYPDRTEVTAENLARYLAVCAQLGFARNLTPFITPDLEMPPMLVLSQFAAAHALLALAHVNPQCATYTAARIREAWDADDTVGDWLAEHLAAMGVSATEVSGLDALRVGLAREQEPPATAAAGVLEPAGGTAKLTAELASTHRAAQTLARITESYRHVMEAARIEMKQNGPHEAMQWILNSLPDVWDDPASEWDGFESAEEWFDRTEPSYRPPAEVDLSAYNRGFRDLLPAERLAVSITSARLARGEDPLPSTAEVLLSVIKRLTYQGQEQAAKEGQ